MARMNDSEAAEIKSRIISRIRREIDLSIAAKGQYMKGGSTYSKGGPGDSYTKDDPTYEKGSDSFKDAIVYPINEVIQKEIERVSLAELRQFGREDVAGPGESK